MRQVDPVPGGGSKYKLGGAVSLDGPGAGVNDAVVMATQQDHVAQLVAPPSTQCSMWWAWHIRGGREQCGNRQCRSRATKAFQIAGGDQALRAPDVENLRVTAEDGRDHLGVAADPPDGAGGELFSGLGGRDPGQVLQLRVVHGQRESGDSAVGLGQQVGGLQPVTGINECVEHPGAVVAGVAAVVTTPRN